MRLEGGDLVNPLVPGVHKKVTHYLNKPAAESCTFVEVRVTF